MSAPTFTPSVGRPALLEDPPPRRGKGFSGGNVLIYAIALIVAIATLGPVLYAVLAGFRSNAQLASDPVGLPSPWIATNYANEEGEQRKRRPYKEDDLEALAHR